MSFDIQELFKKAAQLNASDIHLSAGNYPALRVNGSITFMGSSMLTAEDTERIIKLFLPEDKYREFKSSGEVDSALVIDSVGRYRMNVYRNINGSAAALRPIKANIPTLKELSLPEQINRICEFSGGIVLVTGPSGSGKSTTLAAIINEINITRSARIITLEDPIEFVHKPQRCMVEQREIGRDSSSFAVGLRAALREDPDIILVGEMRDAESISIALTAAETGHLVLSTLHTLGSAKTIDRLVDAFPNDDKSRICSQLSLALKGVISQRLIPTKDGSGRVAAVEIMFVNNAISNLIREGKTVNIDQTIQTGGLEGMIILEKSLNDLYSQGYITKEDALKFCSDRTRMLKYLE